MILLPCLLFAGCSEKKYCTADFIGKTSAQIVAEFGGFDCIGKDADADGLYRGTACGYTIQKPRAGFLGLNPEILFFITFNEDGIAYSCYEGYRPGG